MKKTILVGISLTTFVTTTFAWVYTGPIKPLGPNSYRCEQQNVSTCMESVNNEDPNASVGDKVKIYLGDRTILGTIVEIQSEKASVIDESNGQILDVFIDDFIKE